MVMHVFFVRVSVLKTCMVCLYSFWFCYYILFFSASHRGSISAEHGLGIMKPQYIGHSKTPAAISLMRNIKSSMDPKVGRDCCVIT